MQTGGISITVIEGGGKAAMTSQEGRKEGMDPCREDKHLFAL
jgi:hypothetical protein